MSPCGPGQARSRTSATSCGSGCVTLRPAIKATRASAGVNASNGGRPEARQMESRVWASGSSMSVGPFEDCGGDRVRLIELGQMAGSRNHGDLRFATELIGETLRIAARHDAVL